MAHNETLMLPSISSETADQVLRDIGLLPNGRENRGNYDSEKGELIVSTYDRAKIMVRDQLRSLRSSNPELLNRIHRAVNINYPQSDALRRTFTIGSMTVIRAFNYQLGVPFSTYLERMRAEALDEFELYLACATPLTTAEDIFDEVLNGPDELPFTQDHLKRAIDIMSLTAVSTDFADKLRIGAGCTYLAIAHTLPIPENKNDHRKLNPQLVEMAKIAHVINPTPVPIS